MVGTFTSSFQNLHKPGPKKGGARSPCPILEPPSAGLRGRTALCAALGIRKEPSMECAEGPSRIITFYVLSVHYVPGAG